MRIELWYQKISIFQGGTEVKKRPLKIYFAGDLFNSKDLGGNVMLSDAIDKISENRYQVMLPQNGECEVMERTSQSIRDADFDLLFHCDVVVANFDGTDLDSGTVVEFCFAKMLDLPTVLLRTDFRNSGDATLPDGDPWNLMCSHYPRTEVLHINGMVLYHECKSQTGNSVQCLELYYRNIAEKTVAALDRTVSLPSWMKKEQVLPQYETALKSIGGTLGKSLSRDSLRDIVESKCSAGIY